MFHLQKYALETMSIIDVLFHLPIIYLSVAFTILHKRDAWSINAVLPDCKYSLVSSWSFRPCERYVEWYICHVVRYVTSHMTVDNEGNANVHDSVYVLNT